MDNILEFSENIQKETLKESLFQKVLNEKFKTSFKLSFLDNLNQLKIPFCSDLNLKISNNLNSDILYLNNKEILSTEQVIKELSESEIFKKFENYNLELFVCLNQQLSLWQAFLSSP